MGKRNDWTNTDSDRIRNADDQGAKMIFGNARMCAQFLDGYIPISCLKGLKEDQIEAKRFQRHQKIKGSARRLLGESTG